jgi:hypothetical protein
VKPAVESCRERGVFLVQVDKVREPKFSDRMSVLFETLLRAGLWELLPGN